MEVVHIPGLPEGRPLGSLLCGEVIFGGLMRIGKCNLCNKSKKYVNCALHDKKECFECHREKMSERTELDPRQQRRLRNE